jgi:hypothetical protein
MPKPKMLVLSIMLLLCPVILVESSAYAHIDEVTFSPSTKTEESSWFSWRNIIVGGGVVGLYGVAYQKYAFVPQATWAFLNGAGFVARTGYGIIAKGAQMLCSQK